MATAAPTMRRGAVRSPQPCLALQRGPRAPAGPQPRGAHSVVYLLLPRLPTGIGIRPGPDPAIGYPAIAVGRPRSPAESGGVLRKELGKTPYVPLVGAPPEAQATAEPANSGYKALPSENLDFVLIAVSKSRA